MGRINKTIGVIIIYILLILVLFIAVFPFYWLVISSVKNDADLLSYPPIVFPKHLTLKNYFEVFKTEGEIFKYILNSLVVAILTVITSVFLGSIAAYALSKKYIKYRIKSIILIFILLIRIFPPITIAVPYYVIMQKVGLRDNIFALVITYTAYCLPFAVWLLISFFGELPKEIDEAAIIDGCSYWQRFSRVSLPLVLPGLATTSIFIFIYSWNEFLFASFLTMNKAKTLPVVIAGFVGDKFLQWGKMAALGTIMVLVVLFFAGLAQKYLIRGLTFGSVKE